MNLPVDSMRLKKGLVLVGVLFVVLGIGVGGYYLGMRAGAQIAASQFQELQEQASTAEEPSYLKNPFSAEEAEETTGNPFYQNPFRTVKGLYTEKSE